MGLTMDKPMEKSIKGGRVGSSKGSSNIGKNTMTLDSICESCIHECKSEMFVSYCRQHISNNEDRE
jgi:hypothetical protein